MSHVLTIEGLSKTYPNGVRALHDVSLRIPTGMFGLLGPNGAGKSTLMRTIATLQEPDGGRIMLGDLDVLREKDRVRQMLGYLPQEFGVYPRLSAQALLSHLAALKGIPPAQVKETVEVLLRQTNLWDDRRKRLDTFSGGMKQRFGIAQALIGDPRLIIVDEPTAGLDPTERLRFHNLLSQIGENIVVILSTHIVEDVSDLCSRMAIISQGEVLLTGEPAEAIAALDGRIWSRVVSRDELAACEREHHVIATRLSGGADRDPRLRGRAPRGRVRAGPDRVDRRLLLHVAARRRRGLSRPTPGSEGTQCSPRSSASSCATSCGNRSSCSPRRSSSCRRSWP